MGVRLAYVDFDGHKALEALKRAPSSVWNGQTLSEEFMREHFDHTLEGLDALSNWLKEE